MPQPRTPEKWRHLVFSCLAKDERMPPREIQRGLEEAAEQKPELRRIRERLPSIRTIERIRAEEWKPKTDEEKAPYRLFHWPESMENLSLPWEASGAAFEFMRAEAEGIDGSVPLVCHLTGAEQCDGVAECIDVTLPQIDLPDRDTG